MCAFFLYNGDDMETKFINETIKQSYKAYKKNEVPIGCVIVKNKKIISVSHNLVERRKTTLAHAELLAIKKAQKKIKNWRLDDAIIYVSLQPCLMCINAIAQCRIKKIIYLVKSNYLTDEEQKIENYICKKNKIEMYENKNFESLELIQKFFKEKRKNK